jgi:hypothetical protein
VKRRRASFSQTPEWRKKVNRAKRKLYWFLKAYMVREWVDVWGGTGGNACMQC